MGKGFWAKSQKIDRNDKPRRIYIVVDDNGEFIKVSKVKTIHKTKPDGKNADRNLLEIDKDKYNLEKRSGVDKEVYGKDVRHKKLRLGKDNGIFDDTEVFILDDTDMRNVNRHVIKRHSWNNKSRRRYRNKKDKK